MINQNGVVMIEDARLDEMNCCAQTTNTIPPINMMSPHNECFPISRNEGRDCRVKTQYKVSAIPAMMRRSAESKKGGKLFSAT